MSTWNPAQEIEALRMLCRARLIDAVGARHGVGRTSVKAFGDVAARLARARVVEMPPGFHGLEDAFVDGFRLAATRLAMASERAAMPETVEAVRDVGLPSPRGRALDLDQESQQALLQALMDEFVVLHRSVGPIESVLRHSPVLSVAAIEVADARRKCPEADDRMVAASLIDSREHFAENLAFRLENLRMMQSRNWVLQARLSKQELRAFAAYRVLPQRHVWRSPAREFLRVRAHYDGILDEDSVRYVLVYRSGRAAEAELDRMQGVVNDLRRDYIGFSIPSGVLTDSVRRSLDRMEAEARVQTFIGLRRNLYREQPGLDPHVANRTAAVQLERAMQVSEYRSLVLAGLDGPAAAQRGGLDRV